MLFYLQKKKFGIVLKPALIWGRAPHIYAGFLLMFHRLNRKKSPIDPQLNALVTIRTSQLNDCPFCIDMNAQRLIEKGGSFEKVDELSSYATSSLFSEKEKAALEYTDAMTLNKATSEELFSQLKCHFSDDALVELTALIAFQNMSSKFNAALKIPSQGLCKITVPKEEA